MVPLLCLCGKYDQCVQFVFALLHRRTDRHSLILTCTHNSCHNFTPVLYEYVKTQYTFVLETLQHTHAQPHPHPIRPCTQPPTQTHKPTHTHLHTHTQTHSPKHIHIPHMHTRNRPTRTCSQREAPQFTEERHTRIYTIYKHIPSKTDAHTQHAWHAPSAHERRLSSQRKGTNAYTPHTNTYLQRQTHTHNTPGTHLRQQEAPQFTEKRHKRIYTIYKHIPSKTDAHTHHAWHAPLAHERRLSSQRKGTNAYTPYTNTYT